MAEVNNSTLNFSPVRMKAATEEAAVEQALFIVGATRDQVEVEVLDQDAKGVTVRVSPRRAETVSEPAASAPEAPAPVEETPEVASDNSVESTLIAEEAAPATDDAVKEASDADIDVVAPEIETPRVVTVVDAASQQRAFDAAQEMLERMGMEARAELAPGPFSSLEAGEEDAASRVYLKIEGGDVGILIGKHGQTLQAFQYLLNLTLNNRGADETEVEDALRVVVDAGGYRTRRAVALQQSAQDAATRAKRDRRSIRLEPMPAHERRLVHMALREDTTIQTGSEGREPLRHVVVSPAGMRPSPNDRGNGGRGGYGNRGGGNRGGGYGNRNGGGGGGYGGNRGGGGGFRNAR
jgi:spoIIIJ-associated protein